MVLPVADDILIPSLTDDMTRNIAQDVIKVFEDKPNWSPAPHLAEWNKPSFPGHFKNTSPPFVFGVVINQNNP